MMALLRWGIGLPLVIWATTIWWILAALLVPPGLLGLGLWRLVAPTR